MKQLFKNKVFAIGLTAIIVLSVIVFSGVRSVLSVKDEANKILTVASESFPVPLKDDLTMIAGYSANVLHVAEINNIKADENKAKTLMVLLEEKNPSPEKLSSAFNDLFFETDAAIEQLKLVNLEENVRSALNGQMTDITSLRNIINKSMALYNDMATERNYKINSFPSGIIKTIFFIPDIELF